MLSFIKILKTFVRIKLEFLLTNPRKFFFLVKCMKYISEN